MIYKRHYIQYNDLVFDEIDMVEEDSYVTSWKTHDQAYGFAHGSYSPQKKKGGYLRAGSVSMTITLHMQKLPCEDRPFYTRFVKSQLTNQGKLWAVQDNTLIWAYAILTTIREDTNSRTGELSYDLDFDIPEGIWHKADKLKTFLVPYDVCDFMDCYDWQTVDPCAAIKKEDCCACPSDTAVPYCDCCDGGDCDRVEVENALCFFKDLQPFYDRCGAGFRVIYSCEAANRLFSDILSDAHPGQKFCTNCGELITGRFYSETDLPTEKIGIKLHGKMHNPYIEINGNGNTITGDYEGFLEIRPDGSVYTYIDSCPKCDPLPVSVWSIPPGMNYGWTIEQGYNKVLIDGGTCCALCAYITEDALTF